MLTRKTALAVGGLAMLISIFTGCIHDRLSWSPDGRYLAFAGNDKGKLWRWDSAKGQMEAIDLVESSGGWFSGGSKPIDDKVVTCRYMPSGDGIIFLVEKPTLYMLELKDKRCSKIADNAGTFDVTRQGEIFYVKASEDKEHKSFTLIRRADGNESEIWKSNQEVTMPRVDPTGRRILYTAKTRNLLHLDLDTATSRSLITAKDDTIFDPIWLSEKSFLYVQKGIGDWADLCVYRLDNDTTKTLVERVAHGFPNSLSPDGKTVAVAAQAGEDKPAQIALVDVNSGKKTWLTDDLLNATDPAFSPDGKRIAYISWTDPDKLEMVKIMDLGTRDVTIAWRNDEERLYATALTLLKSGEDAQALASLNELLGRYPKSRLAELANYQIALLYLKSSLFDLDQAYATIGKVENSGEIKLKDMLIDAFWRPEDRVATDPAEDWINTYATAESTAANNNSNTDLTRDLRGLWARSGKDRVYIRVDYGSDKDLTGIKYQDTQILLSVSGPDPNDHAEISPTTRWDRQALSQVLVRDWFDSDEHSHYDLEIKNGNGEPVCRFLASGFTPPNNPMFDMTCVMEKNSLGSVVYSLSKRALGLQDMKGDIGIQVCTYKGGADKLERPRETQGCDVADAFGNENTAKRFKSDPAALVSGIAGTFK